MKFLALTLTLALGWNQSVLACSEDGKSGFLPENSLRIPVGMKTNGGLTEEQFNAVITKVERIYAPIIENLGSKLVVERLWENDRVNALAKRDAPKVWTVQMFGGLARHSTITPDGFALVLCHEIGHHIGGAPKKRSSLMPWVSSEGQSDYFATLKCLRRVFQFDNNAAVVKKLLVPSALTAACKNAHSREDVSVCIRSGMAGASVAALFAQEGRTKTASFTTPDAAQVSSNYDGHPDTQCRLDTFFQGAICEAGMNEDVSQSDETVGTCHGALNHDAGLRPRCWHKPKDK